MAQSPGDLMVRARSSHEAMSLGLRDPFRIRALGELRLMIKICITLSTLICGNNGIFLLMVMQGLVHVWVSIIRVLWGSRVGSLLTGSAGSFIGSLEQFLWALGFLQGFLPFRTNSMGSIRFCWVLHGFWGVGLGFL